ACAGRRLLAPSPSGPAGCARSLLVLRPLAPPLLLRSLAPPASLHVGSLHSPPGSRPFGTGRLRSLAHCCSARSLRRPRSTSARCTRLQGRVPSGPAGFARSLTAAPLARPPRPPPPRPPSP